MPQNGIIHSNNSSAICRQRQCADELSERVWSFLGVAVKGLRNWAVKKKLLEILVLSFELKG